MKLNPNSRIAAVCRPGPENGPFSAQAFKTMRNGLRQNGLDFSAIFAVSGSVPTALLGCTGDEDRLCRVWQNLTPEDVTGIKQQPPPRGVLGSMRRKIQNIAKITNITRRMMLKGSAFSFDPLRSLFARNCDLDKMYSSNALPFKISAVDYLTTQRIIFSNKVPEHKECVLEGALGSMCLVPWFESPFIPDAKRLKLLERAHEQCDGAFLVDGGYRGGLLIEDAIRDSIGFDLIFVIDLHGLQVAPINPNDPVEYNDLPNRIRRISSIMTNTNDCLTMSLVDRINEEIDIKAMLANIKNEVCSDSAGKIELVIKRMNEGRLRLEDKSRATTVSVSSSNKDIPFDFTKFTQIDLLKLMHAGHQAALATLRSLGLNTHGLPVIDPFC